ncbi:MAG: T9SS type A sorting domain-containing protein, partial [Bacteroidota bacterium]
IIKIDSIGNKEWDKRYGGNKSELLRSLHQTKDGGYILGGLSVSGISGDKTQANWDTSETTYDYWIVKIDSLGNKQWDKRFGGIAEEFFWSVRQTTDGGYIVGGGSNSGINGDKTQLNWGQEDFWVVKTDSSGNKQWDKRYGGTGSEELQSLIQLGDSCFLFAGVSDSPISGDKSSPSQGQSDYWFIKTNSNGNKLWDKTYGGSGIEHLVSSAIENSDSGFLLAGTSESDSSGDKTGNNMAPEETWVIKTDSNGIKKWDRTINTNTNFDTEMGYAFQSFDGCYVIANYTYAGIGGDKTQPNWDSINQTVDYFIIKFCDTTSTTSITQSPHPQSPFSISPNPASESITISSQLGKKEIEIYNLLGEKVFQQQLRTSNFKLQTSNFPNGMYIIKAYTDKGVFQQKLVISH